MLAFKWRRHGNQIRIGFDGRGAGLQKTAFDGGFDHFIEIWLHDMNFTPVNGLNRVLVDIHPDNLLLT
ncbi:hypothetical protein D3C86_1614840 [compost metagenome]